MGADVQIGFRHRYLDVATPKMKQAVVPEAFPLPPSLLSNPE